MCSRLFYSLTGKNKTISVRFIGCASAIRYCSEFFGGAKTTLLQNMFSGEQLGC